MNFTISRGERPSPGTPPMVPRMPDMDFMRDIYLNYNTVIASVCVYGWCYIAGLLYETS